MKTIHIIHTCSAFDYLQKIQVEQYRIDRTQGSRTGLAYAVITTLGGRVLCIPLSNIAAIEE